MKSLKLVVFFLVFSSFSKYSGANLEFLVLGEKLGNAGFHFRKKEECLTLEVIGILTTYFDKYHYFTFHFCECFLQ